MLIIVGPNGEITHSGGDSFLLTKIANALTFNSYETVNDEADLPADLGNDLYFVTETFEDNLILQQATAWIQGFGGSPIKVNKGDLLHGLTEDLRFRLFLVSGDNGAHYFYSQ